MNAAETDTSTLDYQYYLHRPISAFDPDKNKNLAQPQTEDFGRHSETQHRTTTISGLSDFLRSSLLLRHLPLQHRTTTISGLSDSVSDLSQNTLAGYLIRSTVPVLPRETDSWSQFIAGPKEKERNEWQIHQAYQRRIEFLCREAELDGFTMNADSERDFWAFIRSIPGSQKASLVLWDNGHLRAVWKGAEESHLGLRFLGDQRIEYVIFKRFPAAEKVSRVAGFDTFDGIKRQIEKYGLTSLVNV